MHIVAIIIVFIDYPIGVCILEVDLEDIIHRTNQVEPIVQVDANLCNITTMDAYKVNVLFIHDGIPYMVVNFQHLHTMSMDPNVMKVEAGNEVYDIVFEDVHTSTMCTNITKVEV